jgi:uncharacterized protein (DUF1015 family)
MHPMNEKFAEVGLHIPEVLLPGKEVDLQKWAVVACDQFSSERHYWEKVNDIVGESPSTLQLIFPECYLEDSDKKERVSGIKNAMSKILESGQLESKGYGFVYIERKTRETPLRRGLVAAVDLEHYDYTGAKSMIRPTEGTILDRLPPRMEVRRGAPLELPHIMVLIDDRNGEVIEKIAAKKDKLPKLYDFDLMLDSGHISGYMVNDDESLNSIFNGLKKIMSGKELLFAVGDGNHSLATAKATWEELKKNNPEVDMHHPSRYALVEIENIYDDGLVFEPIHRVLFNVDEEHFLARMTETLACEMGQPYELSSIESQIGYKDGIHQIGYVNADHCTIIKIKNNQEDLSAKVLQDFLDEYLKNHKNVSIDYIHGTDSVFELTRKKENIGFMLPALNKNEFFAAIQNRGNYPRKTFSLGEAEEKRFYVEARRII